MKAVQTLKIATLLTMAKVFIIKLSLYYLISHSEIGYAF